MILICWINQVVRYRVSLVEKYARMILRAGIYLIPMMAKRNTYDGEAAGAIYHIYIGN